MKVPVSWLKDYVDIAVAPEQLGHDLTMAGLALDGLETVGDDTILDLDITTNRVDAMNIVGIAREVAVLYRTPLRLPAIDIIETGAPAAESIRVQVDAPDLCPRFAARVLDVTIGPSPQWLQDRLEKVGSRSINNLVDLTNYVMLEMGQPSHAFDLAHVPGGALIVRWAADGEKVTTLDGVERTLSPRAGVVAAADGRGLAVAGVMGGASSEVSERTKTIALEAAYWTPLAVRRAARSLAMHTEASHRFERGADPEAPTFALARIAHLMAKIGAGTVRPGVIEARPVPSSRRTVVLRPSRVDAVLGAAIPVGEPQRVLTGLGFDVAEKDGALETTVPTWRSDVAREIDLVEEIARHWGLGRIGRTVPPARGAVGLSAAQKAERRLRVLLASAGLAEAINYSFVPRGTGPAVVLANPLSEEQRVLRGALVDPGLLASLAANLRHGRRDVRLFEIGRVFHPQARLAGEERRLAFLITGAMEPPHWSRARRAADVYDAKGLLEAVAGSLGATLTLDPQGVRPELLHPGRSAAVVHRGTAIGWLGALHPDVAARFDLKDEVVVAEIALEGLLAAAPAARFASLPRFPAVTRDLSLLTDRSVAAATLESTICDASGTLLQAVSFVDRWDKPPVPAGKTSLTVSLTFQDPARTLTGDEVEATMARVVEALRSAGVDIRGGA